MVIPEVIVEEAEPAASPQEGWSADPQQLSVQGALGVPLMSPDMKRVAKQLIEKHTIDNVSLENRLRENENNAFRKMHAKIEERRAKVSLWRVFC